MFWLDLGVPEGSESGYRRPCVVVQNNGFNERLIQTTVVCAITSNLRRASAPGNVLLRQGEAGLAKASVVNISQLYTVDKADLDDYIGTLSAARVRQIWDGLRLLMEP